VAEAEAAVGVAEERRDDLRAQRRALEASVRSVRATSAALPELLQEQRLAQWRTDGDPRAAQIDAIDETSRDLRAELKEIQEATTAVNRAMDAVVEALGLLGSAKSWGTYDTYFGGGLIASAIKHERIDRADAALTAVQDSLRRVRTEMADVRGLAQIDLLLIDAWVKGTDIWFDNIFSDLAVQRAVVDQLAQTERLSRSLEQAQDALSIRGADTKRDLSHQVAQRAALLN
jgi:hypothetical protein